MSQGFTSDVGVNGPNTAIDSGIASFDGTSGKILKDIQYSYWNTIADGRLTLTSGTPVTTSDVTGATTIYYTPYKGQNIALYDGSNWIRTSFSEVSIAVPATTNQMYDIWAYDSSGTLTLELLAWTNDTTRATALAYQDGIYVKSGDTTRRYLGSFRTTGVSGQTEDSTDRGFLWNYYNKVRRPVNCILPSGTHTYTTATLRVWNNTATLGETYFEFIIGVEEEQTEMWGYIKASNSSAANVRVYGDVGIDSTTTGSALMHGDHAINNIIKAFPIEYKGFPGIGYHKAYILEYSQATATTTWNGIESPDNIFGLNMNFNR